MKNKPNLQILSQGMEVLVMVILIILLLTNPRPWFPVLDDVNVMIHEAGRTFFATLGEFTGVIGGSLLQTMIPLVFIIFFKFTKQIFAMAFGLFWLGESLINVSIYIKDARTMLLPVVHGGIHEWNWILDQVHLLKYDLILGNIVYFAGVLITLSGLAVSVYYFLKSSQQLSSQNSAKK
jgi:hypothetical protein